ncbi:MAG TPA: hypothetical protein VMH86_15320 [Rhizomicrobium sp.]|nr:hypothetical protein [Rhizomicrobium sp.]
MSYDSVIQLMEGRRGAYANWHPAVMSWLLGLGDAVVRGTGLFVAADMLLFFGALAGLLLLRPRPHWAGALVAALWIATPQVLIYQATVWKDVLFANAACGGFVCLAGAAALWARPGPRFGLIGGALVFFALAALARQNGILVAVTGAGTLAAIAAMRAERRIWRAAAIYGLGALAAGAAVTLGGHAALDTRSVGTSGPQVQLQLLQTYDVIGAVAKDPSFPLTQVREDDESLEKIIRTVGVRVWSPERNDYLGNTPALQSALDDADPEIMAAQWRTLLLTRPGLYLRVRADVFRWVFLTPDLERCLPYEVGVDGPPAVLAELGLKERYDDRDEALDRYGRLYVGTPVLSHAFFALLSLVALYVLVRRRRPEDIAVAGMLVAAFVVTASFFVISIACDYRYLYFPDLAAMLAVFHLALDAPATWQVLRRVPWRRGP